MTRASLAMCSGVAALIIAVVFLHGIQCLLLAACAFVCMALSVALFWREQQRIDAALFRHERMKPKTLPPRAMWLPRGGRRSSTWQFRRLL